MFGHDSKPSRIYSYGAREPVEGLARVEEQMRLAHRYRNRLVELEIQRRAKVDEALRRLSPELANLKGEISGAEARLEASRGEIRAANKAARRRVRKPDASVDAIAASKEGLKALRARRKEARAALFAGEPWKAEQDAINAWATEEQKRLRAASGVFWGSYLFVEQSMAGCRSGPPPRFMPWRGEGHLAVQLQGGLPVAAARAGTDTRFRIDAAPADKDGAATVAMFRVGTSPKDRSPVWAAVPFALHRPMPEDAEIKWVHLVRRKLAAKPEWSLKVVLSREAGWARQDAAGEGRVGVDVGWRVKDDGSLRVAYWRGSDGAEGDLALPARWLEMMRKVEHMRSVRDVNFNAARDAFAAWIRAHPETVPQALREVCASLASWRSAERLSGVVLRWSEVSFPGFAEPLAALKAWRKRERHLYEYETNSRDQLQRERECLYRNFAAKLRRAYRMAVVEDLDLRDFHELPEAEGPAPDGALREHTRDACLHLLMRCVRESMTETVKAPAPNTTLKCAECGHVNDWDKRALMQTCAGCGKTEDQDRNAATNLLGAAAAPVA